MNKHTYLELFQICIDVFDKNLDGFLQVDKSSLHTIKVWVHSL